MSVATAMGQFGRAVRGNRTVLVSGIHPAAYRRCRRHRAVRESARLSDADFAPASTPPARERPTGSVPTTSAAICSSVRCWEPRYRLLVAIVASLVSLVIGVVYGAIAGYAGGRIDAIMMRVVDTLYAVPFIFFVILLMVYFERNFFLIFVAIGAVNWLDMARIVRGQTLSLKEREFIDAARLIGVRPLTIIFRHITPNLMSIVVVYLTLTVPQAMLVESFLSFLGLGVQAPQTVARQPGG